MSSTVTKLAALGQSLWYDNIERRLLENGELAGMVMRGDISGLTSNPSIFHQAISKSRDYDAALLPMAWAGFTAPQIFEQLAIEDIRAAADLLRPVYENSQGADGYVSLEVSPELAHNSEGTLADALRLWEVVARPNLMIKIPATLAGLPAVRQAIAAGVNVNVTLIFSLERYRAVMEAYLAGLEDRLASKQPLGHVASVASFFISRMDSKVDKRLDAIIKAGGKDASRAQALLGKAAIANARLAYQEFRKAFESERFAHLKANGARLQRPLWASTSTKNPAYPDTLYVDTLIGPHTVNTVPPQTLVAYKDHGRVAVSLEDDLPAAHQAMEGMEGLGISVDVVTRELEDEGVRAFADAFTALLASVEERRSAAVKALGPLALPVAQRVVAMQHQQVPARLHAVDPSLWTEDPSGQAEIRVRMGWVRLHETSRDLVLPLKEFASEVRKAGMTHALLLGMGGSSLAPETMRLILPLGEGGLDLAILDSTDPAQVLAAARRSPVRQTLYIVASKSGGTAEINAFLDYFWQRARRSVGAKRAPEHFVAITDPGTSLEKLAQARGFRHIFTADPHVGGRYSALTAFGLVPAALMGLDVEKLLDRASWMAQQCAADVPAGRNPGLVLGAAMAEAALLGRDKLTLISDPELAPLGAWLEQLIAESSGKQGKGIVPIDGEPLKPAASYGRDRVFVYLRRNGQFDRAAQRLQKSGQPVLVFDVPTGEDVGAEFYRWEMATACACIAMGVNAFDQPDVQDSKTRTKAKIAVYQEKGRFEEGQPAWQGEGVRIYGTLPAGVKSLDEALDSFLAQGRPGDYVALNAYLPRTTRMQAALRRLRVAIGDRTGLATTVGFGPRFLHSTGQLHKGGADNGLFVQITADPVLDVEIPGQGLPFGALERGQSLGDLEALQARGRRILRIHFEQPEALQKLFD